MDKWSVLPTDPRFLDLTEEQRALLWFQYLKSIEPPPKQPNGAHDDDYEEPEKYVDPEFDEEWDNMLMEQPIDASKEEWKEVD